MSRKVLQPGLLNLINLRVKWVKVTGIKIKGHMGQGQPNNYCDIDRRAHINVTLVHFLAKAHEFLLDTPNIKFAEGSDVVFSATLNGDSQFQKRHMEKLFSTTTPTKVKRLDLLIKK